jgi:hypothetical protein
MGMNDAATLRAIVDRQEISDLIHRYCRAVDRLDVPLGRSIWHEDAVADYGKAIYQGPGRDIIDHICAQHLHGLHHSHRVSNILIDLDGDRAGSETYVITSLRLRSGDRLQQVTVWGRYVDRWSRRDGRWGLDKRIFVRDFDEIREVVAMSEPDTRRDRSDPSYAVLRDPSKREDSP